MNGGLFGVRFSVLEHENGAVALVDYLSTFATAPFVVPPPFTVGQSELHERLKSATVNRYYLNG